MSGETFSFVEKLWEGVEVLMERSREGKKTYNELKNRFDGVSSLEKENASNLIQFSKKIQPFSEGGAVGKLYGTLGNLFSEFGADLKGIADKLNTLPNILSSDMELYTTTFEKNSKDIPSLRKKKQNAVDSAQQLRNKYIAAFREWDKADEDYQEMSKDTKTTLKKQDKQKAKAEEKRQAQEKAWKKYSDAIDVCKHAENAFNDEMNSFLVSTQKVEVKRLKLVTKTLSDLLVQFEDVFNAQIRRMNTVRTELDGIDIEKVVDEFAQEKSTHQAKQPLSEAVRELRRNERKSSSPSSSSSSSSSSSAKNNPRASMSVRPFITVQHPLIVYATYDYTPTFPPYNASKPNMDKNNKPLPQNYTDIALKSNFPYLLTRVDYPWDQWCQITSLIYKEEDNTNQVWEGEEKGCAPVSYFNSEYYEYARAHLESNPNAAKAAFEITALLGHGGSHGGGSGGGGGEGDIPPPPPLNESGGNIPPPPALGGGGGGGGTSKKGKQKTYTALYDYNGEEGLQVSAGETLYVPNNHTPEGPGEEWVLVETTAKVQGYIPANYVERNF